MKKRQTPAPYTACDDRILLRPHVAGDIEPLFEAVVASRAELMRWLPWCHEGYGMEETRAWVESREQAWATGEEYAFVVEEVAGGRLLGGCGLHGVVGPHPIGGIGYWIRSDAAGQGLATAATRLIARFGFSVLNLQRLEILAMVENHGSRRVAIKAGGHFEGILRARLTLRGEARDAACYSLLPGARSSKVTPTEDSGCADPWPDPA